MKLLVTGSSGLVGSMCVTFFQERGWEVIGIDADVRSKLFGTPPKHPALQADIRDEQAMYALFRAHRFDAIIHAAAQPSHDWAKDDVLTDFDINARGTLILLEATRTYCPEAIFIHVSTDKVYGEHMSRELTEKPTRFHSDQPFDETLGLDFAGKRSLFGCSKTAADIYAQEYGNYFGMKVAIFRPGCITGRAHEGAEQHGFLAYLAKCVKTGASYTIHGFRGKQVRDQIHAEDLARAFLHVIMTHSTEWPKVYNIGGGPERSVSVLEALEKFNERNIYFDEPNIVFSDTPRVGDRPWDVHDVSKFRRDYPAWDYDYSLDDIFDDLCEKI